MVKRFFMLLSSSSYRDKVGNAGLEYAQENHDCGDVAKQLETVLVGLVKERNA